MARNATRSEIRTALRLADALTGFCRRFDDADPAVPALVGVLAFAACDDEADVDADALSAAVLACAPAVARYAAEDATPRSAKVGSGTTAGKAYTVPMVGRTALSCGCDDHRFHRSDRCKHMISAEQIAAASPGPLPCIVAPRSRPRRSA
jgi:hypothetical protein